LKRYQQLTFSPEDSPASPSPTPVREKRKRTRAGSGPTSPVPFAHYDRDSSSWRTYPDSEDEGSTPYSATLPRSGMTRNGIAYRLPPLARPTDAIGSGLWPTPNASVAQDGEGPATWLARRERLKVTANNGNGAGMPLTIAVQLWATPTAHPLEVGDQPLLLGQRPTAVRDSWGLAESTMGGEADGTARGLDRAAPWEGDTPRTTTDKPPYRVARLRALGNAVVPVMAEWIGRQLLEGA
jgi:hypothetical protein